MFVFLFSFIGFCVSPWIENEKIQDEVGFLVPHINNPQFNRNINPQLILIWKHSHTQWPAS